MSGPAKNFESAVELRPFRWTDREAVILLWERCNLTRPWNNPMRDILRKMGVQPEMFLVGTVGDAFVGTVMAGFEGHRGWINYLAVAPEYRRRGVGRKLMAAAERLLQNAGCPKINLQVRTSNKEAIGFYQRIGYAVDDVVSLGKRLED